MPGPSVQVDVSALVRELERIGGRVAHIPMEVLGEGISTAMSDLLDSEGNGQWEALSDVTLVLHPYRRGGKLLQGRTNVLSAYQTTTGPDWAMVRSPAPYAIFHHTGTSKVRGWVHSDRGMPQRDLLGIDLDAVVEDVARIVSAMAVE